MSIEPDEVVVFLGPTLPRPDAQALLDATYMPPVQQGAVLEAIERQPAALVLIDGYFAWVPSVWHKEILWALDRGIAVYGASSMGALRAAELHAFGMIGHGRVFEDFLEGRLVDDDEVAIIHADSEFDYRPLSDAMVNIRYTLAAARRDGVISRDGAATLVSYCKDRMFYDRLLSKLLHDAASESIVSPAEAERLLSWLPSNAVDVKREDAIGLLSLLAEAGVPRVPPSSNGFMFQPTTNWLQLGASVRARRSVSVRSRPSDTPALVRVDELLAECRVAGDWPALEAMALARILAATPRFHEGTVSEEDYLTHLARVCVSLGLGDLDEMSSWLGSVGWTSQRLSLLVQREAMLAQARSDCGDDLRETVAELIFLTGRDKPYADRALRKREWFDSTGDLAGVDRDSGDAVAWFRKRLGARDVESDETLAHRHGWSSTADMADDLVAEHAFWRGSETTNTAHGSGAIAGRSTRRVHERELRHDPI